MHEAPEDCSLDDQDDGDCPSSGPILGSVGQFVEYYMHDGKIYLESVIPSERPIRKRNFDLRWHSERRVASSDAKKQMLVFCQGSSGNDGLARVDLDDLKVTDAHSLFGSRPQTELSDSGSAVPSSCCNVTDVIRALVAQIHGIC
jgi:hypothetical protein